MTRWALSLDLRAPEGRFMGGGFRAPADGDRSEADIDDDTQPSPVLVYVAGG